MNRKKTKSPLSRNLVISRLGKSQVKSRNAFSKKNSPQRTSRVVRHQRQNVSVCRVQETSCRFLNHHNASREMSARIRICELRTEEHHGEWVGTKYFEPKNPFSKKKP